MSGHLIDIVAIIDMDGYSVNKIFLCKPHIARRNNFN